MLFGLVYFKIEEMTEQLVPDRVISLHRDWEWPVRSCDLMPCDFLCGGLFSKKCVITIPKRFLSKRIRSVKHDIQAVVSKWVVVNFNNRCAGMVGGSPDVIFHT